MHFTTCLNYTFICFVYIHGWFWNLIKLFIGKLVEETTESRNERDQGQMPGRLFQRNIRLLWEAAWEIRWAAENQRIIHLDKATGQFHLRCNTLVSSIAVLVFLKLESSWDQTKQDESPWMVSRKLRCCQHICKNSSFISKYHLWTCQMKLQTLLSLRIQELCELHGTVFHIIFQLCFYNTCYSCRRSGFSCQHLHGF